MFYADERCFRIARDLLIKEGYSKIQADKLASEAVAKNLEQLAWQTEKRSHYADSHQARERDLEAMRNYRQRAAEIMEGLENG